MKKVAVIMGSDSDWPVVQGACRQLDEFKIPYEAHILSAHRTLPRRRSLPKVPEPTASVCSSAPPAWPPTWLGLLPETLPCPSSASR